MLRQLFIFSESDSLVQIADINLHTLMANRCRIQNGCQVLCTFFHQKLTTALFASVVGTECKYFLINLDERMLLDPAEIKPLTFCSPGACLLDWDIQAYIFLNFVHERERERERERDRERKRKREITHIITKIKMTRHVNKHFLGSDKPEHPNCKLLVFTVCQ